MISNVTLPTNYQQFIHKSRYARWMDENERREEWHETVHRYVNFMSAHLKNKFNYEVDPEVVHNIQEAILHQEVMPSMRAMMTAGKALDRDNTAGYN